jgi:dUTP pyrophosphatase
MMELKIKRMGAADLPLPARAHPTDAGLDLAADLSRPEKIKGGYLFKGSVVLMPDAEVAIPCGFAFAIPEGWQGQVVGRSGLAFKNGIKAGHIGTVDSAYRGEVMVLIRNESHRDFTIEHAMRIAQLVLSAIPPRLQTVEVAELDDTDRGASGFGSTGIRAKAP